MPSRSDLESAAHRAAKKISDAASWLDVEQSTVSALGKPTFAIGVISGLVKGAVVSVADLVLLSKTLVLADYHVTYHARTPLERATGMLGMLNPVNLFTGAGALTVAAFWPGFDRMAEEAYQEREELIKGLKSIFQNPGATFDRVVDAQKAKYAQWEAYNNSHSLSGEFHAGVLFGELLLDVLLIVDGVTAIAKLASKAPTLIRALTELTPELQIAARNSVRAAEELAAEQARTARLAREAAAQSGKEAGEVNSAASTASKKPDVSTKPAQSCSSKCSVAGEPVSMVSGEEMLEREDFTWHGPLAMVWRRFYRSGSNGVSRVLGHGWLSPLDEVLDVDDRVTYTNCDGQQIDLPLPDVGGVAINIPEKLRLYRDADGFRLVGESGPERVFAGRNGRCALSRFQERAGFRIDLLRNADDTVHAMVANWGRALVLGYAAGRIVSVGPAVFIGDRYEPAGEPFVRYAYSTDGDLVSAVDRLGNGEKYRYRRHLLVRRTLASGFNFYFEWDGEGPRDRCIHSWGDGGIYDYRFEWLPDGISRAIDSRGGVTTFEHNAAGQLLCKRSPEGRETRFAYNTRNLLASQTDSAGNTTHYRYDDAEGRLSSITDGLGHRHRIERDADGQITAVTDPLGHRWTQVHDAKGRLIESSDPLGAVTRHIYNAQGLLAVSIDASGRQRRLLWDEHMRLVGDIGFDGIRRRYQYDAEDRIVAAVTQDRVRTRYEYDATGCLTAVHAPNGRSTRLSYNAFGLVTRYTDAAGNTTEYRYADGLSQVTSRIDALGQVMRYEYDLERNLVALENAKGERYNLAYDADERLIAERGFDGREQRYEYSRAGHLLRHLAGGKIERLTEFERDCMGRLLSKRLADGSTARFGYDACGRLVSAVSGSSAVELAYDAAGRIVREVQDGQVVASRFDLLGRRTSLRTPSGQALKFRHDEAGRVIGIALDGESLSEHRYDEFGREVGRTQGALATIFEHDPMGRLVRQQAARTSDKDAAVLGRRYGYDDAGQVASIEDLRAGASGISRYVYDPVDRLVQVEGLTPERFVHDPAGNLLGESAQGGLVKGDRLLVQGDRHYAYDEAGNLVEQRRGKGGHELTRYGYDGDNRLVSVDGAQGRVDFGYDALGRRTLKRTASGETRFVYDGVHLLGESSAGTSRTFVFEPNSFRPLAVVDEVEGAPRRISHYHLDHLGTPRELTNAQGRVVWSARYRAYGALALAEVCEVENPLRFQGQYHDTETDLHYNLNRYYDPAIGRFIHQDPIGLAGGDNLYKYALNPANWVDPLGLTPCPDAVKGVSSLSPSSIRFSQSSVNGVDEIAASMRADGWKGAPIDVVRMSDGSLTTFDNTRLLAAQRAGIDVQATIRGATEAFPAGRWTPRSGVQPATWEDAIRARIQQQNSGFRSTYPNGSPYTGSTQ